MCPAARLSPAEAAATGELVERVRALLGEELCELRLFGSRARGEGTEQSDLDIAVIVTPRGRARRHEVHDLAFDIGYAHGVDIAAWVVEEGRLNELRTRERRIALDVDREGIRL